MTRKRDFSNISSGILTKNDKPRSLSDLIGVEHNTENEVQVDPVLKKEEIESEGLKKEDPIIRECISISRSDFDIVNDLAVKCAAEGQRASKADVYRASIRHFSKLSPSVMASKIREVRKDKKTHK